MFKLKVKFDTVCQIKKFVNVLQAICADFDLVHNRYTIDAKSIMGIFSMDLSKPVDFIAHTDDPMIQKYVTLELEEIGIVC